MERSETRGSGLALSAREGRRTGPRNPFAPSRGERFSPIFFHGLPPVATFQCPAGAENGHPVPLATTGSNQSRGNSRHQNLRFRLTISVDFGAIGKMRIAWRFTKYLQSSNVACSPVKCAGRVESFCHRCFRVPWKRKYMKNPRVMPYTVAADQGPAGPSWGRWRAMA